jgi:uncharacterized protein YjiS (DUF1127 family)
MTLIYIDRPRRSAWSTLILGFAARCLATAAEIRDRMEIRRSLDRLSVRQMRDIGLIQNDVEAVCSERLLKSARTELRQIALSRARNW